MAWILPGRRLPSKAMRGALAALVGAAAFACLDETMPARPEPCDSQYCVDLPIAAADTAFNAYGVWPFGVHGSSHAADGHPGWDIEFAPGASARAADDGSVLSLFVDTAGATTVQISHSWRGGAYRTVYTNLASVAAGVTVGAPVTRGQALGVPRVQTRTIGSRLVTYAAIHFQFDDFASTSGLTNVNAVSPEMHLRPDARALFAAMWRKAVYNQELCEPFATNSRETTFPFTRRWLRGQGTDAATLSVTCAAPDAITIGFSLSTGGTGTGGTFVVNPLANGLSEIDFTSSGVVQRGLFRIVSDTMLLQVAQPGEVRPTALSAALQYLTQR